MATIINIKIRNNNYPIACDESQDQHVKKLAYRIDDRIKELSKNFPKANDATLLIMVALNMENEIFELETGIPGQGNSEHAVIETIDAVSDYVETLAKKLEKIYNNV